ncbi:MAG: helix-turn-helix transcriptional regulator [Clostridia bacterium]|nr:helix-turn-helix transcriptional regulator [Clostridia bacterium]
MDTEKVGKQIALLRKNKKLTQSELGERISVSFQAVSKWE